MKLFLRQILRQAFNALIFTVFLVFFLWTLVYAENFPIIGEAVSELNVQYYINKIISAHCPGDRFMKGFSPDGEPICEEIPSSYPSGRAPYVYYSPQAPQQFPNENSCPGASVGQIITGASDLSYQISSDLSPTPHSGMTTVPYGWRSDMGWVSGMVTFYCDNGTLHVTRDMQSEGR